MADPISDRLTTCNSPRGKSQNIGCCADHVHYESRAALVVSMASFSRRARIAARQVRARSGRTGRKETRRTDRRPVSVVLTRDLNKAKMWLRTKHGATNGNGIVVSFRSITVSNLLAIEGPLEPDPVSLVLAGKDDIRSSLPFGRRFNRVRDPGARIGLGVRHLVSDFRYARSGWSHMPFAVHDGRGIIKRTASCTKRTPIESY